VYFIFVQIILCVLGLTFFRSLLSGSLHKIGIEKLLKTSVVFGRSLFFIGTSHIQNTTLNSTPSLHSPENIAFASLGIAKATIAGWIDFNMFSVVSGALPLTFWLATKHFELIALSTCESIDNSKGERIIDQFTKLKIITSLINSMWAPLVISILIQCALMLTWLHSYTEKGNQYWLVSRCIVIALVIIGATIMAEGCRVVSYCKI